MNEIWKDIECYKGLYQVSNLGNVKSIKFKQDSPLDKRGRIRKKINDFVLKPQIDSHGYCSVVLSNKKIKRYKVHRLVGIAFILNHKNKSSINHINGIKTDNRIENLEWVTPTENMNHAKNNGLNARGEMMPHSKFKQTDIPNIINSFNDGKTCIEISKLYNVKARVIYRIIRGESWGWTNDWRMVQAMVEKIIPNTINNN